MVSDLYCTTQEIRTFLQFDDNDFPTNRDIEFFIRLSMKRIALDVNTSNENILFIACLYLTKFYVTRALATRSVAKGYVQVNAEGRTITKSYQELVLEAENIGQEYKEFIVSQVRKEVSKTNFFTGANLSVLTRTQIIDIMNGKANAEDMERGFRYDSYSRRS